MIATDRISPKESKEMIINQLNLLVTVFLCIDDISPVKTSGSTSGSEKIVWKFGRSFRFGGRCIRRYISILRLGAYYFF